MLWLYAQQKMMAYKKGSVHSNGAVYEAI